MIFIPKLIKYIVIFYGENNVLLKGNFRMKKIIMDPWAIFKSPKNMFLTDLDELHGSRTFFFIHGGPKRKKM